jgi:hypothetical protein
MEHQVQLVQQDILQVVPEVMEIIHLDQDQQQVVVDKEEEVVLLYKEQPEQLIQVVVEVQELQDLQEQLVVLV